MTSKVKVETESESDKKGCCNELREEFRVDKLKLEHLQPQQFVSPQCFKSTVYIIWSGVWAVYHVAMLMLDIYYNRDSGGSFMIYLTNWTYIVISGVAISDFVITIYVHIQRKDIIGSSCNSTTWYMKVHWVFFNITNTGSLLVTLLYYALLDVEITHSSINKHLLNSVYALSSLLFSAKPVRLLHFYHPVVYALIFIVFSVIYHVTGGGAIYSTLDWSKTGSAILLTLLVLCLGVPIIHTFCFALYTLRLFLWSKCCNQSVHDVKQGKSNIQREITPRDVELNLASRSRPQTRMSIVPA